jgi:hypothetical protein
MKSDQKDQISYEHDLYCRTLLKENDRDFYFLSLLDTDKFQAYIFRAFWLLVTDIEKIRRVTAEPAAATLRLKWWMDAVENLENHQDDDPTRVLYVLKQAGQSLKTQKILTLLNHMQQEVIAPRFSTLMELDGYLIKKSADIAEAFVFFTHHENSVKIIHRALWIRLLKSSIDYSSDAALLHGAIPLDEELRDQFNILKRNEETDNKWLGKISYWNSLMLNKKGIQPSKNQPLNLSHFRLSGLEMLRLYFK